MDTPSVDKNVLTDPSHLPDPHSSASPRPSRRNKVNLNWVKDTKIKTAKCRICGQRAKSFSHRCEDCEIRICSECSELDGKRPPEHKRVATDYLTEGCWCGCPKGFNRAFSHLYPLPPVMADDTGAANTKTQSKKRKREPTQAADAAEKSPETTQEIPRLSVNGEEQLPWDASSTIAAGAAGSSPVASPVSKKRRVPQYAAPEIPSSSTTESVIEDSLEVATPDATLSKTSHILTVDPAQHLPVVLNVEEAEQIQPLAPDVIANARDDRSIMISPQVASDSSSTLSSLHSSPSTSDELAQAAPGAPEGDSSPKKKEKRLDDGQKRIVILGAGVIGLFVALELAQNAYVGGEKQDITVVDINSGPGLLASGQSTGLLTIHGMPDSWLPLVEAAADAWKELTASEPFCEAVDFTEEVSTIDESCKKHARLGWLHKHLNVACDQDSLGLLDAMGLNQWLHSQCERFGVHFWFDTHATRIERDRAGEMIGVRVQSVDGGGAKPELIRCTDLVLSAGPYTPQLFKQLWPNVHVHLSARTRVNQWVKLSGFDFGGKSRLGLTIPNLAVNEDEDYDGAMAATTVPRANVISVSCCRSLVRTAKLKPRDALEQRRQSTATLCALAARYFHAPNLDVASSGSSYIGTGYGNKPIIGHAPLPDTHKGCSVWLCYGFGNHGTTVAPGVGRIVAAMVHAREVGTDVSSFAAPTGQLVMPTGKGKE